MGKDTSQKSDSIKYAGFNTNLEQIIVIAVTLITTPLVIEVLSTSLNVLVSTNFTFVLIGVILLIYAGIKRLSNSR